MQGGARRRCVLAALAVVGAAVATEGGGPARALAGSTAGGLTVWVSYAENIDPTKAPAPGANFPAPWKGDPNIVFLGNVNPQSAECGGVSSSCYDAGAIRLDNNGTTDVTVSRTVVDVHSALAGGKLYDTSSNSSLWGSFKVPAGKSVILTENPSAPARQVGYDNFDTSDTPHYNGSCTPVSAVPTVQLTIGATVTTLSDSTHVLDTGAVDSGWCPHSGGQHNESIQWRQIGSGGGGSPSLTLSPLSITKLTGQSATETATLLDGGGSGLPNTKVDFRVTAGPDAGGTGSATTDGGGRAAFTYIGAAAGKDTVVARAGTIQSNTAQVTWTSSPPTTTQLDQLDDFGGLHSVPPSPGASSPALWTFKIARDLVLLPGGGGGYILDGWGGIHAFGTASTAVTAPAYWLGWDIARGIALLPGGGGGYVLDGWGGIHPFAVGANPMPPAMLIAPFWLGWDIARAFVLDSSGTGGYTLDGWGGVHPFGTDSAHTPAAITVSPYWPNWDIARSFVLRPDGVSGYTLDGWGGVHPFAIDSAHLPGVPTVSGFWLSTDIARSIVLQPGLPGGGYVLNGWGDIRAFGSAPPLSSPFTTPGQDISRALAVT
jgi:hypothetical protein